MIAIADVPANFYCGTLLFLSLPEKMGSQSRERNKTQRERERERERAGRVISARVRETGGTCPTRANVGLPDLRDPVRLPPCVENPSAATLPAHLYKT